MKRKETIRVREEANEIRNKETIEKINKTKFCVSDMNYKTEKPLAR